MAKQARIKPSWKKKTRKKEKKYRARALKCDPNIKYIINNMGGDSPSYEENFTARIKQIINALAKT